MSRLTRVALTLLAGALYGVVHPRPQLQASGCRDACRASGRRRPGRRPGIARRPEVVRAVSRRPLTALVTTALKENFEVRIAAERVLQARAAYGITRADQFPTVDVSADVDCGTHVEERRQQGHPGGRRHRASATCEAGFSLGWELDVWGRLRRLSEAARAQYLATDEARRGVVTTLVADVTQNVSVAARARLSSWRSPRAREMSATNNLRLIDERRTAGVASGLDVRQAEQLLFTATGQIAEPRTRDRAGRERAEPAARARCPATCRAGAPLEAFQVPPAVPAGLPSALLERRPDIRQAEQQLIAANAQIGAAKAEYFPRISLTGFLGGQSRALSDLLTGPARVATAGLGAAAPIFNAGRTRATSSSRKRCSAKRS